jgi:signal transduction histidine kinase
VLERLSRLSIRWRLAVISAALTFVILAAFSAVIGELTASRIRTDFDNQTESGADHLAQNLSVNFNPTVGIQVTPRLEAVAAPQNAQIRVLAAAFNVLDHTKGAPDFGNPVADGQLHDIHGYRVATRLVALQSNTGAVGSAYIQFGRPISDLEATIRRVRLFLLFGVFGGSAAALAGGLLLARRSLKPIAQLTATSREIARTRDLSRTIPIPEADDEVAELARTMSEMLAGLEASRAENAAILNRQRQFVADASHELRTPLTSVLANLELLSESLDGDELDAARSALRSSQRMRRLVADLLLLARADARPAPTTSGPREGGAAVVDAAAELGPLAEHHELNVDVVPDAIVTGARDELTRLALNLMENAVKYTPPGTVVNVSVRRAGDSVVLAVEDDGPGVAEELRERLFERFVRGSGDRSGSFGLGLSIVAAITAAHGGTVAYEEREGGGARFVVSLPANPVPAAVKA